MRGRAFAGLVAGVLMMSGPAGGRAIAGQGTVGIRATPLPRPAPVPSLPPRVLAAAMSAPGTVVRREAGLVVERVTAAGPGGPGTLYRVRVAGEFPPRALRYVVFAGTEPVGYGIPVPSTQAVRTVTPSNAVLERSVTARPESKAPPASDASAPSGAPSPSAQSRVAFGRLAQGPFEVARAEYHFGNRVYLPPGLRGKVEVTADVHYPKGLNGGPFPLVLFLHGNHVTCSMGTRVDYRWPCRPGWTPIPNYRGYDYIARRLAGFGYVVVSVSANGVNVLGNFVDDTGMRQRGLLLEHHVDLWRRWNNVGGAPFGTRFVGKIDLGRIGVMGHSRGGEGAVYHVIVDRARRHPYGIDAVLALAPVDFTRRTVNRVPLAVMLPYCDGDVSDLQGVHFFDDARYRVPGDPTPKHTVTVFGANHDFFNTVWTPGGGYPGGYDDGTRRCPGRLSSGEERHVGSAYVVDFFRRYVGGELSLDPVWTGVEAPAGAAPARTLVSYLAPDTADRRRDLDRFTGPNGLGRDRLGGDVTSHGLSVYGWCADTFQSPCVPGSEGYRDVHLPGMGQGVIGWEKPVGVVRFDLPEGTGDVSGFDALQLRTAFNTGYPTGFGVGVQDLAVALVDGAGNEAAVTASAVGDDALKRPTLHFILNQVRFPLTSFAGVDLTDVRRVELRFDQTQDGVIDIADLAFTRGAA